MISFWMGTWGRWSSSQLRNFRKLDTWLAAIDGKRDSWTIPTKWIVTGIATTCILCFHMHCLRMHTFCIKIQKYAHRAVWNTRSTVTAMCIDEQTQIYFGSFVTFKYKKCSDTALQLTAIIHMLFVVLFESRSYCWLDEDGHVNNLNHDKTWIHVFP